MTFLDELLEATNQLFEGETNMKNRILVNVRETENEYLVDALLPGVEKEDINIICNFIYIYNCRGDY